MNSSFSEKRVDLTWGSISVLEDNPTAPIHVVALHGWLDNAFSFSPLVAEFGANEIHWNRFELAGHGTSDPRPPGVRYDLIDYAFDTATAIEKLDLKRVHLLGHSLGGAVALLASTIVPDRIESVAVIESVGPIPKPSEPLPVFLREYYRVQSTAKRKPLTTYSLPKHAAEARAKVSDLSVELAEAMLTRSLKPVPGGWVWRSDPRLRLPIARPFTDEEVQQCLSSVSRPTLVLLAEPGLFRSTSLVRERLKQIPHAKHATVRGGHHVHLEDPKAVGQILREYWKSFREV